MRRIYFLRSSKILTALTKGRNDMPLFDNSLAVKSTVPQHINGISCDVQNCVYHDGDNYCTADRVNIGNPTAANISETRCSTFEMRGEMTRS